jgi:phage replication-related protein YjqB (UPF0714/DUF867 family)
MSIGKTITNLANILSFKYIIRSLFLYLSLALIILLVISLSFSPSVLADTFCCFDSNVCAKKSLRSSSNYSSPKDYNTFPLDKGSNVTVLSFHGGCIEPYTSEISEQLADKYEWNRYDFQGHVKGTSIIKCYKDTEEGQQEQQKNFRVLHITSTNFDDPEALKLVKKSDRSVSIHGYSKERDDKPGYETGTICVGGRNEPQVNKFIKYIDTEKTRLALPYKLNPIDARQRNNEGGVCNGLQGINSENIVNKNKSKKGGLQLELSYGMRRDLAIATGAKFNNLREIVYGAVAEAMRSGEVTD